ncbi:dephospho-CoA kinase [Aquitalea aquatica]|uniref:Dephospho-CoA kinase n=1 Tax=Aquitalea aquatica TaxID=3044273 RepID=A0A838Y861_9NEIS|nr:dephospho-CoA kinase [Aquitalea magnusonii]MBA4706901.1 dephospho-CoA kinase [Aquitalea magnusonii]
MPIDIVGLTGGIGSGKSAAAAHFAALGVPVVDADVIAHALTGPNGAAMPLLTAEFGRQVVAENGALNRAAMRALAFADPDSRRRLESILHPLIRAECVRQLDTACGPYALLVVPLLFENPDYLALVRRSLLVDCAEEVQLARVQARSGLTADAVRAIMAAQMPRVQRLAQADDVIDNDGSLAALQLQVEAKHQYYLANLAHGQ